MESDQTTGGRAFAYVRMSSTDQELGDSRRRQIELAKAWAADRGLDLVTDLFGGPFEDIGLSAFTGEHLSSGKLGLFVEAIKQGTIKRGDFLLVENFDRVTRQEPFTAFRIFGDIIEGGVTLVTTDDRREYKTGLSVEAMINSLLSFGRSNEESEKKRIRIGNAWAAKRENAGSRKLTSRRPEWLEVEEWDYSGKARLPKSFKPIPERVKIVRRIFEESAAGIGMRKIAQRLNDDKVAPFGKSRAPRTARKTMPLALAAKTFKTPAGVPLHRWRTKAGAMRHWCRADTKN